MPRARAPQWTWAGPRFAADEHAANAGIDRVGIAAEHALLPDML